MATFTAQYTDKDFTDVLKGGFKTVGYVTKKVGCARSTAVAYLERLEKEGKIKKVPIDDGAMYVWTLIE